MATITQCPKCTARLLVSGAEAEPTSRYKCPTCDETFELAAAFAALADPIPEAIALDGPPTVLPSPAAAADPAAAPLTAAGDSSVAIGQAPRSADAASDSTAESGVNFAPQIETGEDDEPHEDFDIESEEDEDEGLAARARRRQPKQGSIIGTMVGIVGGGVVGIAGALIILKIIQGDKFQSPIPLPNISWKQISQLWTKPETSAEGETVSQASTSDIAVPEFTSTEFMPFIPEPTNLPGRTPEPTEALTSVLPLPLPDPTLPPIPAPAATSAATAVTAPKLVGITKAPPADVEAEIGGLYAMIQPMVGDVVGVPRVSPKLYQGICQMSDGLAFLDDSGDDQSIAVIESARVFGLLIASSPDNREQISKLSAARLAAVTPEDPGIAVAGIVQRLSQYKRYRMITIARLDATSQTLTIVTPERIRLREGDQITVFGAVIDKPQEQLAGFEDETKRVIWAGLILPFPAP